MIGGLLPLLVLGLVVYGATRALSGRHDPETGESLEGDTREVVVRLFRLVLLAASVILVAEGVSALIAAAIPESGTAARDALEVAQALSFTVVGVPALAALVWWTRRRLAEEPDEASTIAWAAYLGGMEILAFILVLFSGYEMVDWALGSADLDHRALGRVVSWSAVLAVHWVLNAQRPLLDVRRRPEARTPAHLLIGSGIALVAAGYSVWTLFRAILVPIYDRLFGAELLVVEGRMVAVAFGQAVIGVGFWIWWWWLHGLDSPRGNRWYAYTVLVGVLGGLVVTISALATVVHAGLQWVFGDPSADVASVHFDLLPGSLAALVVGIGIWSHHRIELAGGSVRSRSDVDRVYDYVVAFVGVVVSAIAVTIVVSTVLLALAEAGTSSAAGDSGNANSIVLAVTFALVGLPLWWYHWSRAERHAKPEAEGESRAAAAELGSLARRVFVTVTLGVGAIIALIALVVTLMIFFEDMANSDLGAETVRRLRVPLGMVVSTAVVALYHGLVYRDDRAAAAALQPPPPEPIPATSRVQQIVLISDLATNEADALIDRLVGSAPIRSVRYRTGIEGRSPAADEVDAAVDAMSTLLPVTESRQVLVTAVGGTVTVQPLLD